MKVLSGTAGGLTLGLEVIVPDFPVWITPLAFATCRGDSDGLHLRKELGASLCGNRRSNRRRRRL